MRGFSFVLGLVAGAFVILIAQNLLGLARPRMGPPPPAPAPETGGPGTGGGGGGRGAIVDASPERLARIRAELEASLRDVQGKNLDPVAVALDEARFDGDWGKVDAVARLVREHGAAWVTPDVAPPPVPVAVQEQEKSLPVLARELERRREQLERASRRNEATDLLGRTDAESVARLVQLFEQPPAPIVRHDAADGLARSGDERAIAALTAALRDRDEGKRRVAAAALARAGYLQGAAALAEIARRDPDPAKRGLAVRDLAQFDAVVRGDDHLALRAIVEVAREDTDPEVRGKAVRTLAPVDLAASRPALLAVVDALDDGDARVRGLAVATLRANATQFGPAPGALEAVEAALPREAAVDNRLGLLELLGLLGDEDTLRALDAFAATAEGRAVAKEIEAARAALRDRLGLK